MEDSLSCDGQVDASELIEVDPKRRLRLMHQAATYGSESKVGAAAAACRSSSDILTEDDDDHQQGSSKFGAHYHPMRPYVCVLEDLSNLSHVLLRKIMPSN